MSEVWRDDFGNCDGCDEFEKLQAADPTLDDFERGEYCGRYADNEEFETCQKKWQKYLGLMSSSTTLYIS